eukprot:4513441-Lingulodinium_polyedra.AAC.1
MASGTLPSSFCEERELRACERVSVYELVLRQLGRPCGGPPVHGPRLRFARDFVGVPVKRRGLHHENVPAVHVAPAYAERLM